MEAGRTLGPYEILEPLGAGGMGEVWLAEDTRLGRKVAIKVLPAEFASDPERLSRFEQEARAAAALNHPHIAAVYDVGFEDDTHFMVQEYLQGRSLRDALEAGPVPQDKSLALGTEIAEALRAAHRAGIVHRDLKPENIFITLDGHAKVLDFGLAKLTETGAAGMSSESMSPTVLGTQAGSVMGTAGYMAPEQVQGEGVDHRADLFAFGCVLYELLTGRRAFAGKSVPHTLHKILDEEPDGFEATTGSLPLRLRWLLQKCLSKSADSRAQSAGDVVVELQQVAREVESGTALSGRAARSGLVAGPTRSGRRLPLATAIPVAVVVFLLGAVLMWILDPSPEAEGLGPVRFTIALPRGSSDFSNQNQRVLEISPDGRLIIFNADDQLWLRAVDDPEPVPLRGTSDPRSPSFSPDSSQLAFWTDDQIRRIGVRGGAPVVVGSSPGRPQGVHWAADGFIYVGDAEGDGIWRLPETGGQPQRIVDMSDEETNAYGPQLLPGDEWLMFTVAPGRKWDLGQIVAQSLTTGERRVLVEGGHDARFSPTGHLLYVTGGVLLASQFDMQSLQATGGAVPLIEHIRSAQLGRSGAAYYDISATGALISVSDNGSRDQRRLAWVDPGGNVEPLPIAPAFFGSFMTLAPDGRRLAITRLEGEESHVWIYEVDRPGGQRLTTLLTNTSPVWSADGEWVYFATTRSNGVADIWRRRADLSGPEEEVFAAAGDQRPDSVSSDGRWLYYTTAVANEPDLWRLPLEGGGEPEPVVATPAPEFSGRASPDGRYLAFTSIETTRREVFVTELATSRRWRISAAGGAGPRWSAARNEIYYEWEQGVYVVDFANEPEFNPAVARLLRPHPRGRLVESSTLLSPDGERTLELFGGDPNVQADAPHVDVVLNWSDELVARAPIER